MIKHEIGNLKYILDEELVGDNLYTCTVEGFYNKVLFYKISEEEYLMTLVTDDTLNKFKEEEFSLKYVYTKGSRSLLYVFNSITGNLEMYTKLTLPQNIIDKL